MTDEGGNSQKFDEAWAKKVLQEGRPSEAPQRPEAPSEPFPVPDTGGGEHGNTGLYANIALLLDGGAPDPPQPSLLLRDDGFGILYSEQVNYLFGDPESGKTWVGTAATAEALCRGMKALIIDLDHNGPLATACRLIDLGVPEKVLRNLSRFRYVEPEDREHLKAVIADAVQWAPDVVLLDSAGELMPLLRLSSNSPDDFTVAHTVAMKPLAIAGAAVIVIDHLPKNAENRANGPTGTAAKRRAIGGVSIRVTVNEQFTPGRGGSAWLAVNKDRHGGLRRHCPAEGKEPSAGLFRLDSSSDRITWSIRAPQLGDAAKAVGVSQDDIAALDLLDPAPSSVRDVKDRLKWGTTRAANALQQWRSRSTRNVPEEQGTQMQEARSPFPTPGVRNEEHDPQTDQNVVPIGQSDIWGGVWEGTPA